MSFVYQAGVFTSYAINLGLADKQLQNQLLSTQAGTAASLNKLNRSIVSNTISPSGNTDANYDATLVLTQGLRSTEDTLVSNLDLFYTNTLYSTDTYFQSVVGFSFRNYFDRKTTEFLDTRYKKINVYIFVKSFLENFFSDHNLTSRVSYLGWVNPRDCINKFDFYLDTPQSGLIAASAFAAGMPTITFRNSNSFVESFEDDIIKLLKEKNIENNFINIILSLDYESYVTNTSNLIYDFEKIL
jgi:hypothetical protein